MNPIYQIAMAFLEIFFGALALAILGAIALTIGFFATRGLLTTKVFKGCPVCGTECELGPHIETKEEDYYTEWTHPSTYYCPNCLSSFA